MSEVQVVNGQQVTGERQPVRRALISVYDKTGVDALALALAGAGVVIVSTGSTAARIAAAGVEVTRVEQVTGFPECFDGRVKTLHPRVHGGVLADRRLASHREQLSELGIEPFDLVVVNLYPFADTVASGATPDAVVEQIDIGGPTLVRAAAKNHANVAVVVDPTAYDDVVASVLSGGFTVGERATLAAQAFRHTAEYDIQVATWMGQHAVTTADIDADSHVPSRAESVGEWTASAFVRQQSLRYGENPHQPAALYRDPVVTGGLAQAVQHHGKEMSFNNYVDADAALRAAFDQSAPAVAIIKHANPCGIAVGDDIAQAHARAHATDPVSAFGGVVAANRPVSVAAAEQIAQVFTEVVVAPAFEPGALEVLSAKKSIRLLEVQPVTAPLEWRRISGGLLVQRTDAMDAPGDEVRAWHQLAGEPLDAAILADLEFAWRACRSVKSNAILLARDGAAVGIGMGQVNRVDSCRLAVERAGADRARGSVAASDAFFPFADGLQVLADAGVRAVVSPGGSVRDAEVIDAAQAAGIALLHTGARHFFH